MMSGVYSFKVFRKSNFLDRDQIRFAISAENDSQIAELLSTEKPDVVLNCIGVVKQLQESKDLKSSESANSKLPHLLSEICQKINARLIHFSTDCVFSGRTGNYKETDKERSEKSKDIPKDVKCKKCGKPVTLLRAERTGTIPSTKL